MEFVSLQLSNVFFCCVELALGELRVLLLMKTLCVVETLADMCGNMIRQRKSSHNCIRKPHKGRSAWFLPDILLRLFESYCRRSSFLTSSYLDCFSFEVHTAVSMKITKLLHRVAWYICTKLFGETCCLHNQVLYPEDGGNKYIRNVGDYQTTALHISEFSIFFFHN